MKTSCLIEVEFEGPDAEKGPQIMVDKSNNFGKIPLNSYGANCSAVSYKLASSVPKEPDGSAAIGGTIVGIIIGVVSSLIYSMV